MNKNFIFIALASTLSISNVSMANTNNGVSERVEVLEQQVTTLEAEVTDLNQRVTYFENLNVEQQFQSVKERLNNLLSIQHCHAMPQVGVDWHGCDKRDMKGGYEGAPLWGANLMNSHLVGVNFSGTSIILTNFRGANLQGANFTNVNLHYSNLEGANIPDVIWENTTCPDGTNSDYNGNTCEGHLVY